MKQIPYPNNFTFIFLLAIVFILNACDSNTTPPNNNQPAPDLAATVNAQVNATIAASNNNANTNTQANQLNNQTVVVDTNPPLTLPFNDNFDAGLDSNWRVLNGNPVVVNGKLGAARAKDIYLEIGNNDLQNYTVTFDVAGGKHPWGGYSSNLYLTLIPDLQVKLSSADLDSRVEWFAFADDEWDEISETRFKKSETASFKMTVSGNTYTLYANGQVVSELVYGSTPATSAPLIVQIYGDNIWLDNFSIH